MHIKPHDALLDALLDVLLDAECYAAMSNRQRQKGVPRQGPRPCGLESELKIGTRGLGWMLTRRNPWSTDPELAKGTSYLLIDGRKDRRHDRSLFLFLYDGLLL